MSGNPISGRTGADKFLPLHKQMALMMACCGVGFVASKMGLIGGLALIVMPIGIFFLGAMFVNPRIGIFSSLFMSFFISGFGLYIDAPWGLTLDIFLFISWLGLIFRDFKNTDWTPLRNDIVYILLAWYGFIVFQLVNPEAPGPVAWFYAMRGVGFYQLLGATLIFMLYRHPKWVDFFLVTIMTLSLLGTLWGLRQQIFGVNSAEYRWLWDENHHEEHVLFGVLRVFSFYSDAGQFGASQAMMSLIAGIIALGNVNTKTRVFYGICCIMTFIGFAISGTRGALAIPAAGGLIFLITSKNFRILIPGLLAIIMIFYVLKYTKAFQHIEQVRRMRTALDPNNPSLKNRLDNQKRFGRYLASRPLGGGIGSAGFWGSRFNPGSFLSLATDSWYVKIWAETGIVGICIHLFTLGYIMGKGGHIVWHIRHPVLRQKIMALYSAYGGVLLSSYGNQVFGQMPTGMIMTISIPLIMMAPMYDNMLMTEENGTYNEHS